MLKKPLAVVIPVGPDDVSWRQLLDELSAIDGQLQIILAACQKKPDDFKIPGHMQWLQTTQGRASQLNAGARRACADYIWFLHADTHLTAEVISDVQGFIDTADDNKLGYFRLRFAGDGPKQTRFNAWAANIRSRWFGLPFGDQGFLLSKKLYQQMHGFDENIGLGEDLDFVVRVNAAQIPLIELPAVLITSARRYQHQGWLRTTIRHLWLTWYLTRQAKQRLSLLS